MIREILIVSAAIVTISIYVYSTYYYLTVWRKHGSGSAHAFFLVSLVMAGIVVFEATNMVWDVVSDNNCYGTLHDVYVWILFLPHSVITLAYVRGYFIPYRNMKE